MVFSRLVFALAIALLLVSAKTDNVSLKYNLKVGNTYKLITTADQTIEMTMMGQAQNIKNKIEGAIFLKVLTTEGKVITFDTWYDKLKMSIETGMGSFVMRSDSMQDSNPGSKMLNTMMNKHFTIKMSTSGEILEVSGSDKVMEDALNAIKGLEESQMSMMKESIKQFVGKDALKGSFELSLRCLPDKPVSVGDSWTSQVELVSALSATVNTTWKLSDRKNGVSVLEGKSTLKTKENAPSQNISGIPIKYNIKGEQQILSKIDEKTGWIIESTINQDISGEMEMDLSAQGSGIQKAPIKIKSKTVTSGI